MKLLVSPTDVEEAKAAVDGGADIVDVKNPTEGSLGANFPWVIAEVKALLPRGVELSATIGDLDFKPGTASLAAYCVASLDVDYVKAGFYGVVNEVQALEMGRALKRAISGTGSRLVIAGYADHEEIGSIDPFSLPEIARRVNAHGVMVDTARKNGVGLLKHVGIDAIEAFVVESKNAGLMSALAGSLDFDDLTALKGIQPDVIGIRGLACMGGDRDKGRISAERVERIRAFIR
ncbi:MAG: (5-formylfuran-3-yl)methyl phosphate synthase [Candidatus Hydrothermarchaeaceae archaeon]